MRKIPKTIFAFPDEFDDKSGEFITASETIAECAPDRGEKPRRVGMYRLVETFDVATVTQSKSVSMVSPA